MAKLEKPTLNKSKKPVADAVIGQMIAAEPEEPVIEKKMTYTKDKNGVTVGPKGNKIGRKPKADKKEQLSFSISKDMKDKLVAYCESHGDIAISAGCAMAVQEFIENHSK